MCASCGSEVVDLSFTPSRGSKVLCSPCFKNRKYERLNVPELEGYEVRYNRFRKWKPCWRPRKGGEREDDFIQP